MTQGTNKNEHSYVYVLIRRDLSQPQQVVQSCHAAIEAAKHFDLDSHPSVIVCGVKSEQSLNNARKYLDDKGIRYKKFREPDIGDQLTSLATEPVLNGDREHFKKFQLLKGNC